MKRYGSKRQASAELEEITITSDMVLSGIMELQYYDFDEDDCEEALIKILTAVFSRAITVAE